MPHGQLSRLLCSPWARRVRDREGRAASPSRVPPTLVSFLLKPSCASKNVNQNKRENKPSCDSCCLKSNCWEFWKLGQRGWEWTGGAHFSGKAYMEGGYNIAGVMFCFCNGNQLGFCIFPKPEFFIRSPCAFWDCARLWANAPASTHSSWSCPKALRQE